MDEAIEKFYNPSALRWAIGYVVYIQSVEAGKHEKQTTYDPHNLWGSLRFCPELTRCRIRIRRTTFGVAGPLGVNAGIETVSLWRLFDSLR